MGLRKKYDIGSEDLHLERKTLGFEKNTSIMSSPAFKKACELAGTPLTRRQASKYRQGRGLAYRVSKLGLDK